MSKLGKKFLCLTPTLTSFHRKSLVLKLSSSCSLRSKCKRNWKMDSTNKIRKFKVTWALTLKLHNSRNFYSSQIRCLLRIKEIILRELQVQDVWYLWFKETIQIWVRIIQQASLNLNNEEDSWVLGNQLKNFLKLLRGPAVSRSSKQFKQRTVSCRWARKRRKELPKRKKRNSMK